jgi:glycerol uptake facilitator-like aquaporin
MSALSTRLVSEAVGTGLLVVAVVGSGIMGERLADGNVAVALLANSIATGAALIVLISILGPVSGAHFNPVVTLADAWERRSMRADLPAYIGAQIFGGLMGVALANTMFDLPLFFASTHSRNGSALLLSEVFATFGLILTIRGCAKLRSDVGALAVAAYITGAYWFTSSTSFANPAVTLARAATDTFAGIRPADVPGFVVAQLLGAGIATTTAVWLFPHGTEQVQPLRKAQHGK